MKIGIGSDHRGYRLKTRIINFLKRKGHKVFDFGTNSEEPVDYPEIGIKVARAVAKKGIKFGILLCYTGQGMAITANKVKGVRAAVCSCPEIARSARAHNDANVLSIPAGFVNPNREWQSIIDTFLNTKFEGSRHRRRLNIIKRYEDSPNRI